MTKTTMLKASQIHWSTEDLMWSARYAPVTIELDNYAEPEYLMISTFVEPFTGELLYICRYARLNARHNKYDDNIFSYGEAKDWLEQF